MITNEHLNEEVKTIEEAHATEKSSVTKAIIKGILLIIKLLRNVRTNTMLIMKKLDVEMVKPKTGDSTKTS